MSRAWLALFIPLVILLAAACNGDDTATPTPTTTPTATPGTPTPEPTEPPTPTATPTPAAAVCLEAEVYVADGAIAVEGPGTGDADRVGALRWAAHEGCERFVIDLLAEDGSPADGAGEVEAEVLRDLGVVRVQLLDVEWVEPDATDATFDGPLATDAFAVWSPDGRWTYVDIHLGDPAEAAVTLLDDRVVVDLVPGGGPVPVPAARDDLVVVLAPRPGPASYPLTVTGYARTFEANVIVRIEQDGVDVFDDFTTSTAWVDAWGHYTFTIDDGPAGAITLHIGEIEAAEGEWRGAAIELEME